MNKFDMSIPNILVAGGVDKYPGFLQFISDYCDELEYTPKIIAIFDKDGAARQKYDSLKNKRIKNIDLSCHYIIRFDNQNNNDIELEDYIYPDLVFDAVNKLLRKKKYHTIKKADRKKRTLPAYNKKPILDFITEICRTNNENEIEIDFNSLNIKLFLSKHICTELQKKDIKQLNINHPEVKNYLEILQDIN
jgi:hypothetical protein